MHRLDTSETHRSLAADDIFGLDHPVLRCAESLLNLHPLHQVIPVDWAEIARALRTVTLGAMRRPDRTVLHLAELNPPRMAGRRRHLERYRPALAQGGP